MAKQRRKHVPQRSCIACRQKRDKRRLTRLVRTANAGIVVDTTGKQAGRGAYVCEQSECWEKVLNGNVVERALRIKLSATDRKAVAEWRRTAFPLPDSDENEDNV